MSNEEFQQQKKLIQQASKKASASKASAQDFLYRAGILTKAGNLRQEYQ